MQSSVHNLPAVSVSETLRLGRGIVDLWYYFYEGVSDINLLAEHEALMTADEHEKYMSFYFKRDRSLFLATRALVRTVLSSYMAVAPDAWRFALNDYGKPKVLYPVVKPIINFNLSNTHGLVVCVVSVVHECIGVDVEGLNQTVSTELAGSNFSNDELHALRHLQSYEYQQCFFAYWTLKESYVKARGFGLRFPLDQFSFVLDGAEININFAPGWDDDAVCWRFALLDVPPYHMVAIAINTGGAPISLRATRVVPLDGVVSSTSSE